MHKILCNTSFTLIKGLPGDLCLSGLKRAHTCQPVNVKRNTYRYGVREVDTRCKMLQTIQILLLGYGLPTKVHPLIVCFLTKVYLLRISFFHKTALIKGFFFFTKLH